jgi:hypothetical protein
MSSDPITLAVHGDATIHHPAERGTVRAVLSFDGIEREPVVRATSALHERITAAAASHQQSGAATWWSADRVAFSAYKEWNKNVPTQRFRAGATVEVKFRDFGALSTWVTELGEVDGVTAHVSWALTEVTRVDLERRVRIDAVQEALRRATDYAASLSRPEPRLVAVYEPGLRPSTSGGDGMDGMSSRMRMAGGPAASESSIELKPEDIAVSAAVTADFVV